MKMLPALAVLALFAASAGAQCTLEKMTSPTAEALALFGSTHICGDRMIVGARTDDDQAFNSGAAFVYRAVAGVWAIEDQLIAPGNALGAGFGASVAVYGDYAAVGSVGSPGADVFHWDGIEWVHQQALLPDGPTGSQFGWSVDIENEFVIVAGMRTGPVGAGHIFQRTDAAWSEVAVLQPPDPAAADSVTSVAISGDRVLIGSRYDHGLDDRAGAAFVYRRSGTAWEFEQRLTASDGGAGDGFGWQCDIDGDRIIVGALFADVSGEDSGQVYVFEYYGSQWVEVANLVGSDTTAGNWFGAGASIAGDYAVAGATVASGGGEAYLFERVEGVWSERLKYQAPDSEAGDRFGTTSTDGVHVLIGAMEDDNEAGADAGAVYVTPLPASARFTASRTFGKRPLAVAFSDQSIGNVTSYLWDFGDGFLSTLRSPVHTYRAPGVYTVTMTANGPCGASIETKVDHIRVPPHPLLRWLGDSPRDGGAKTR